MKENFEPGQRITWRSLTFQLLAIVVFPLIALLLFITFRSTTLHQNAMRELVGDRDERAARMASTAINDQVQRRANEIRALAGQVSETSSERWAAVISSATFLHTDFNAGMAVFDKEKNLIASQGDPKIWQESSAILTEGIAALQANPNLGVYVSKAIASSARQGAFMVVIAPVSGNQEFLSGAFLIEPMVEHIFTNVFPSTQETSVAVVSPDKDILFQIGFNSGTETIQQHTGVADALAGKYGTTYIDVAGSEHVIAYSSVQPLGWALLIEEPWEQVASPALETTHIAPLVLVPVLLLALLAVFFGIRQIVQPLQSLASQSGRLGWGDYNAIEKPVGGVLEIRQLQLELIHMAHKLRAAQQSLHSYIGAITSGQEEERRRLARELHDDTIQSLIAFKQRVQLVEMDWDGHPVAKALVELEQAAEQTIENLRRMVSALRPIYLEDLGLVAAIDMLTSETGKNSGATVAFQRQGKEKRLDAPVELALYRIVQEALSNIIRHSGASQASVLMTFQQDGIRITIQDNGKGFTVPRSPAEFAPSGHFGLLGMFERAELIGGEIEVDSSPGKGTQLTITAPYAPLQAKNRSLGTSESLTAI
jgi:signal transduction histidine kinase